MTDVQPAPEIPDGVTLLTELPPRSWPFAAPKLRMTYVGPTYVCSYFVDLLSPELSYSTHLNGMALRALTRKVADTSNVSELIDLHRDICFWTA